MALVGADDVVNTVVMAAQAACEYASCWAPATTEMAEVMGKGSGGPVSMGEGAAAWASASDQIAQAHQSFTQLVAAIPRDYWDGDDRTNFDTEMTQLGQQLDDAHTLGEVVADTLTGLTFPLAAWPLMAGGVGLCEFLSADYFYAAAASGIGDVSGVAEEAWAQGEALTLTCVEIVNTSAVLLISLMAAATAAIAIGDAVDVTDQYQHGDQGVTAEFGKASVDSAAQIAANLAAAYVNTHTKGDEDESGGEPGAHAKPDTDTGDEPSSHLPKLPVNKDDVPTHMPKHSATVDRDAHWDQTYTSRLKQYGGEKGTEKLFSFDAAGDPDDGVSGLSQLINQGINWGTDGSWNKPDAPSADEEDWGA